MLHDSSHPIAPSRADQAGYDGLMKVTQSKEIRFSIKNYGKSKAQEEFERQAQKTNKIIEQLLKKYNYPPLTIVIDSPSIFPTKTEWTLLFNNIDHAFQIKRKLDDPLYAIVDGIPLWIILIHLLPPSIQEFHQDYKSYTYVMSSAYHKNEKQNIYSKLDDACANLITHSAIENDNIRNMLFIHLPLSASMKSCSEWLRSYLDNNPHKPISGVILYQPSVSTDVSKGFNYIHHSFATVLRPQLTKWLPSGFVFSLSPPVGIASFAISNSVLVIQHPDGKVEQRTVDDRYIYQHGEHFYKMQLQADGSYLGSITQQGSGIFVNSIIEFPGQPGHAAISGRFPPNDDLLIL
jgi:hypothetical protein